MPPLDSNQTTPAVRTGLPQWTPVFLLLLLAAGCLLRITPLTAFHGVGFDENLYRAYVTMLNEKGIAAMPRIVEEYITTQQSLPSAILPPTRFLYIFFGHLWSSISGTAPLDALHDVSAAWSVLTLLLSSWFAWRLGGMRVCLGVTALMACAPIQIHMGQHALIDGFFAFWALLSLYLLWENLRAPKPNPLLATAFGTSLALMVMTKENSFFVFVGICGLIACAPFLGLGKLHRPLLFATVLGPAAGVGILVALCGGPENFMTVYLLLVEKAYTLQYAILTGDGPWYRYLVDLLLSSPLVLLLAVGAVFRLDKKEPAPLYLALFVGITYLIMCNIKYGMNLRYTNMWDMPLRCLAFGQMAWLSAKLPRHRDLALMAMVGLVCALELRNYATFFMEFPLYELVSEGLLRALKILKSP